MKKYCLWCEKELQIKNNSNRKYCQVSCQKKYLYHKKSKKEAQKNFQIIKKCKYCEKNFQNNNYKNTKNFCSKKCIWHYNNKKCSLTQYRKKLSSLKCEYCKKEFAGVKLTQRFCSNKCADINLYHEKNEYMREYQKKLRLKNIERYRELDRLQHQKHKEKRQIRSKKYRQTEEYKERRREKDNKRYSEDILFNLKKKLRVRIKEILKSKNIEKNFGLKEYIGCSSAKLKKHLESKFTKDMSWNKLLNGEIHIDHIKPISLATTEEEMIKLNHYTNLQPLWAKDNIIKKDKWEGL